MASVFNSCDLTITNGTKEKALIHSCNIMIYIAHFSDHDHPAQGGLLFMMISRKRSS